MDKYYTPKIEEFHVGFEYEEQVDRDEWITITIEEVCEFEFIADDLEHNQGASIRVRYLDQEDLESLGFKYISGDYRKEFKKNNMWIVVRSGDNYPIPDLCIYRHIGDSWCFSGIVKNKSELKVLLKQLEV